MRIKEIKLKRIIEDELRQQLMVKRGLKKKKKTNTANKMPTKEESDRERKRRVFGKGYKELDKLALGIVEDDELEEANPSHSQSGEFSSKKDATCDSTYFVDQDRKRKGGSLTDKHSTGRGKKKSGQGKYRCKDNTPKWENLYREFVDDVEPDVPEDESVDVDHGDPDEMYDCAKQRQDDKVLMRKLKQAVRDAKNSGGKECGLSIDDAVKIINTLELAGKGKAFEPPKAD